MNKVLLGMSIDPNADPFSYLGKEDVLSHDDKSVGLVFDIASDWFGFITVLGIIAFIVTISVIGIKLMLIKDSKKRSENKDAITWKVIILMLIELIPLIVSLVLKVAMAFVG